MGLLEGSIWPKVTLVTLAIAFLFYLIAFGAPTWCKTDESEVKSKEHIGLWKYCTYPVGGGQSCDDFIDIIVGDWLTVSQAFMSLALFSFLGAIAVVVLYAFVPDFAGDMRIFGAAIGLTGATFLFLLISVATFGVKCHEYFENKQVGMWNDVTEYGWAFYFGLTTTLLTFLSIIFLVLDVVAGEKN